jgi:hypothetical protein
MFESEKMVVKYGSSKKQYFIWKKEKMYGMTKNNIVETSSAALNPQVQYRSLFMEL